MRGFTIIDAQTPSSDVVVWVVGRNPDQPLRPRSTNAVVIERGDERLAAKVYALTRDCVVVATPGSDPAVATYDGEHLTLDNFEVLLAATQTHREAINEALSMYAVRPNPKTGKAPASPRKITRPVFLSLPKWSDFEPREISVTAQALAAANYVGAVWHAWLATDNERASRVESPPRMTPELSDPQVAEFPAAFARLLTPQPVV